LGFHSPKAAVLSISAPPEPANQGPVAAFGNRVFVAMIRFEAVPSSGSSNPQSPTRLFATVKQSAWVVVACALAIGAGTPGSSVSAHESTIASSNNVN
jgi:hypothetical protein